jgi:hypothetical protein
MNIRNAIVSLILTIAFFHPILSDACQKKYDNNRYRGQPSEYRYKMMNGVKVQMVPIWCVNRSGNRWICDWERA